MYWGYMSKVKTYYQTRLPDLIEKLKSQVDKNLEVINREVESSIGEEKYLNVFYLLLLKA